MQNLINENNRVAIYDCIPKSKVKIYDLSIKQCFELIKNGTVQDGTKIFNIKSDVLNLRRFNKGENGYDTNKLMLPCFTWSGTTNIDRKGSYIEIDENGVEQTIQPSCRVGNPKHMQISNLIYFDIDEFNDGQTIEDVEEILKGITYIKAFWRSLSGKGIGGVVNCLTADNPHNKKLFADLKTYGLTLDKATRKSISIRINVISYDPNIFIRDDKDCTLFSPTITQSDLDEYKDSEITGNGVSLTNESEILTAFNKSIFNTEVTKGNQHISKQRTAYTTGYVDFMVRFGVPKDITLKLIIEKHPDFKKENRATIHDWYKRYPERFGMWSVNGSSNGSTNSSNSYNSDNTSSSGFESYTFKSKKTIQLKEKQYLSDIAKDGEDLRDLLVGRYIIGDTGIGKSQAFLSWNTKKIILCPTKALAREFVKNTNKKIELHNSKCPTVNPKTDLLSIAEESLRDVIIGTTIKPLARLFDGTNREVSINDNLIVSTYDSYNILSEKIDTSDFDIIFDEVQNVTTCASKNYRLDKLNDLLNKLYYHSNKYKSLTFFTGTPVFSCHPIFDGIEVLTYKMFKPKDGRNAYFMKTKGVSGKLSLIGQIQERADFSDGHEFLSILLNNKHHQFNKLLTKLPRDKYIQLNSDMVGDKEVNKLLLDSKLDKKYHGLIATNWYLSGNSLEVQSERKYRNIVLDLDDFNTSIHDKKQFSARVRNTVMIDIITTISEDFEESKEFTNPFYYQNRILRATIKNCEDYNEMYSEANNLHKCNTAAEITTNTNEFIFFDDITFQYCVNYLAISHKVYTNEINYAHKNLDFTKFQYAEYDIEFLGIKEGFLDLSSDEEQELKNIAVEYNKNLNAFEENLIIKIQEEGLKSNKEYCEANKFTMSKVEGKIRRRLNYVYNFVASEEDVFLLFELLRTSENMWKIFERAVGIKKVSSNDKFKGTADWEIYNFITTQFKVGEVVSTKLLTEMINNLYKKVLNKPSNMSDKKVVALIESILDVRKSSVRSRVDGKQVKESFIEVIGSEAFPQVIAKNGKLSVNVGNSDRRCKETIIDDSNLLGQFFEL